MCVNEWLPTEKDKGSFVTTLPTPEEAIIWDDIEYFKKKLEEAIAIPPIE